MAMFWCCACGTPISLDPPTADGEDRDGLCPACVAALLQPIPLSLDDRGDDDGSPLD